MTGGERRGLLIPGFDLANSPADYSPDRVAGATIVFTTTNGTRALRACAQHGATRILVGCLANLSAVAAALAHEHADAHLVCAATHDHVSLEDVLAAGALAHRLTHPRCGPGFQHADDDSGRIAQALWDSASTSAARLRDTLAQSLGGRNVLALGLDADLDWCARVDVLADVLPEFDAARGEIRRAHPPHE